MQQAWTIANGLQCVQETHCREETSPGERERELKQQVETSEYDDGMLNWESFWFRV